MFTSVAVIEDQLSKCLADYNDDRCSLLELLRYFSKHPYTRFSRAAVIHGLRNQGVFVERGLKYLTENRMVTIETENGIKLYSLNSNDSAFSWAQQLGKLDCYEWHSILKQIKPVDL